MTVLSLLFFAVFGIVSAFVENSLRVDNISNGIKEPIDHGKLVERRVIVGTAWMFGVVLFAILFGNFSWKLAAIIPMAMGVFGTFHRLAINYSSDRGPWYLGVDSKIDQYALRLAGMNYIYPNSATHYEAWSHSIYYASKVKKAAIILYSVELTVAVVAAYISL